MTLLAVVVGLLFVAGLVGSVLPWLPGPLFILIGAFLWAMRSGQFEDLEGAGWRAIQDEDPEGPAPND